MNGFGDYPGEMESNRVSDSEIEDLLAGSSDVRDDLTPLVALFETLRTEPDIEFSNEAMAGFATAAADAARATGVVAEPASRLMVGSMRRRAAAVVTAATVFLGGTSGLAIAADGAKPGDPLYGIDRAFEAIGIGAGEAEERFVEVEALVEAGEVPRGLQHAAEAVDKHGFDDSGADDTAASEALEEAADRVRAGGSDQSAATRERVAGLLGYISENFGDLDGNHVAELAREIGGPDRRPETPPSQNPGAPGPPDHSPADPPGRSEPNPGPPDHVPANPPGHSSEDSPGNSGSAPGSTKPPKTKP